MTKPIHETNAALGDLYSAGFHAYALFSMMHGFKAYRELNLLESASQNAATQTMDATELNPEAEFGTA